MEKHKSAKIVKESKWLYAKEEQSETNAIGFLKPNALSAADRVKSLDCPDARKIHDILSLIGMTENIKDDREKRHSVPLNKIKLSRKQHSADKADENVKQSSTVSKQSTDGDVEEAVKECYENELLEASTLRFVYQTSAGVSSTAISAQETDIKTAFFESNMLRAQLKVAYVMNKSTVEIIQLYTRAILKEMSGRTSYGKLVLNSAWHDADLPPETAQREWELRCEADELVVQHLQELSHKLDTNTTKDQRVKLGYDVNRAKAILKADRKALTATFSAVSTPLGKAATATGAAAAAAGDVTSVKRAADPDLIVSASYRDSSMGYVNDNDGFSSDEED